MGMRYKQKTPVKNTKKFNTYNTHTAPPVQTLYKPRPRLLERTYDPSDYKVTHILANGQSIAGTGVIVNLLSNAVQGSGYVDRFIGSKIDPVGLEFRYDFTVADATNIVRCIIFQWFDASTPAVSGVLQTVNSLSPINATNRENINVLKDNLHCMAILATGGANIVCEKIYVKGKRMSPAHFNENAVTWQKGCLYALLISDSALISHPGCDYYSRVTYVDM